MPPGGAPPRRLVPATGRTAGRSPDCSPSPVNSPTVLVPDTVRSTSANARPLPRSRSLALLHTQLPVSTRCSRSPLASPSAGPGTPAPRAAPGSPKLYLSGMHPAVRWATPASVPSRTMHTNECAISLGSTSGKRKTCRESMCTAHTATARPNSLAGLVDSEEADDPHTFVSHRPASPPPKMLGWI